MLVISVLRVYFRKKSDAKLSCQHNDLLTRYGSVHRSSSFCTNGLLHSTAGWQVRSTSQAALCPFASLTSNLSISSSAIHLGYRGAGPRTPCLHHRHHSLNSQRRTLWIEPLQSANQEKKRNPGICYELAVIYSTNFRVMDSMETLQMIHTFR